MHKVVSNTTPIISLLKIDKLDLLRKIYGAIIIPREVFLEIEKGKSKVYYNDLSLKKWIHIQEIQDTNALHYFIELDAGEAETIVLAKEIEADLVIIDEILGRRFTKHAGLKVTGTLGVLIKAKESGYIPEISPLLSELQTKGIWISDKLKRKILSIVKE